MSVSGYIALWVIRFERKRRYEELAVCVKQLGKSSTNIIHDNT